jgi:hypothetical protein
LLYIDHIYKTLFSEKLRKKLTIPTVILLIKSVYNYHALPVV